MQRAEMSKRAVRKSLWHWKSSGWSPHCPIGHAASRRAESRRRTPRVSPANDARRDTHQLYINVHRAARASRCSSGANVALILGEPALLVQRRPPLLLCMLPWTRTTYIQVQIAGRAQISKRSPPNWKNAAARRSTHGTAFFKNSF